MKKKQAANANLPSGSFELDEEALEQVVGGKSDYTDTGTHDKYTGAEIWHKNGFWGGSDQLRDANGNEVKPKGHMMSPVNNT